MEPVKHEIKNKYQKLIEYEAYGNHKGTLARYIKIRFLGPSTYFVYLIRKMQMHHEIGGVHSVISKLYFKKIYKEYGCCVFPGCKIGVGLKVYHPVSIVIGHCKIGKNCTILQGVTIGEKNIGEYSTKNIEPVIGNNCVISANSTILGNLTIADNVIVGANSLVIKSIENEGVYAGLPALKIR